jgi:hypothetical protein
VREHPDSLPGTADLREQTDMSDATCLVAEDLEPCSGVITKHGLCVRHFQRWRRTGVMTRRELILQQLPTGAAGECWLWSGRLNKDGYGVTHVRGASSPLAHRLAYEVLVGAIPEGMTVDHMCHRIESCEGGKADPHRRCCNPAHLNLAGAVPNALRGHSLAGENSRKTVCDSGHKLTDANTYWYRGHRQCRICRRKNDLKRTQKDGSGWERQRRAREAAGRAPRPEAA